MPLGPLEFCGVPQPVRSNDDVGDVGDNGSGDVDDGDNDKG